MNRTSLRDYIEKAFDFAAFEDAFLEAIQDWIDYDEIAANLLSNHAEDIADIIEELAEDAM